MLRNLYKAATFQNNLLRCFHTSSVRRLRELYVEQKDKNTTVIGAKYIKSPRENYILKFDKNSDKCPLCQLQLDLKHTDVLILSQYITSDGNILKQFQTGLCKKQYKLVKELIYMAQYAGLLPEPPRESPRKPHELLNTYYDETTINLYPKYKVHDKRFFSLKLGPIEKMRIRPEKGYFIKSWNRSPNKG